MSTTAQYTIYNRHHAYTFTGTLAGKDAKHQQAIVDTVCYLGWMSLKDSEHNGNAKAVKEAVAVRKAAESLLSDGTITIMGTWSNGIAVGPGPQFAHIQHPSIVVESKKRRARTVKAGPVVNLAAERADRIIATIEEWEPALGAEWDAMARRFPNLVKPGACYDMRYDEGASCPVSIRNAAATVIGDESTLEAVARPQSGIDKPRVRYTWPVAQPQPAPTPIRTTPAQYTPAVGDTIFVIYRHEDGRTTDRVIDVQRVGNGVFRGYDRRYNRTRNFYAAQIAHCERWDGCEVFDHNGNVAVAAA